jgi:molybdopterin molybdotransferase
LPEAVRAIRKLIEPVTTNELITVSAARARILGCDQTAPMNVPPFDNSAMDGYAIKAADFEANHKHFQLVGSSLAGHPYTGSVSSGECIRITTGAMLCSDVDTVIPQENCSIDKGVIIVHEAGSRGANIRRAGNDVKEGSLLMPTGHQLTAFDIAWLSACGVSKIDVRQKPRIAFFSTGDELREPGTTLAPGQIYDSNRQVLSQLLCQLPVDFTDMGVIADDRNTIESALKHAANEHDLILTSGGVSVGTADYLKEVVQQLGTLDLWRLNLKPGKPLACGRIGASLFLGLPGNPVSTIVTFLLIAQPAILTLSGCLDDLTPVVYQARLGGRLFHSPGREEYQRGTLHNNGNALEVHVTGEQASNRLGSFADAGCLIRVPKQCGDLEEGSIVDVYPLRGLIG